jgi:hypothetical protein
MMRVRLQVSGGLAFFPGLAAPRTIDVETLPDLTRRSVMSLLDESQFFSLASPPPSRGAADHHEYQITVDDGARQHTVVVSDPVTSEPLRALIELLHGL